VLRYPILLMTLVYLGCGADSTAPTSTDPVTDPPPADEPAPVVVPSTADMLEPGPYAVEIAEFTLVDPTRETPANGTFEGAPDRTLETAMWFPKDATEPLPVLVYSHGYMSEHLENAALLEKLAALGFLVAAADFPLSNRNAPGGPTLYDLPNMPGDVSFIIDEVLRLSAEAGSKIEGLADPDRVAVAGLSLGGITSFLASYHPELGDSRIKSTLVIGGPLCTLPDAIYRDDGRPVMFIYADTDQIAPYAANGEGPYGRAHAPKYLATIEGGTHIGFAGAVVDLLGTLENPDGLGCDALMADLKDVNLGDIITAFGYDRAETFAATCPMPCEVPVDGPPFLPIARQQTVLELAVTSFLRKSLTNDAAAGAYLEQVLDTEADIRIQLDAGETPGSDDPLAP